MPVTILRPPIKSFNHNHCLSQLISGFQTPASEMDCTRAIRMPPTMIVQIAKSILKERSLPETNIALRNLLACTWRKEGLMYSDGAINWRGLQIIIFDTFTKSGLVTGESARLSNKCVATCNTLRGITPGHTCILILNCMMHFMERIQSDLGSRLTVAE